MKINAATQLFQDFTDEEASQMRTWSEDVILRGDVTYPDPPFITRWLEVMGFDQRQRLMVIATVLPQRVLLSLVSDCSGCQGREG